MPNYVYNTIEFDTDEDAKRVWDALSTPVTDDDGNPTGESRFDFNALIPMPASLDVTSGSITTDAIVYALISEEDAFDHAREVFESKLSPRELERNLSLGEVRLKEGSLMDTDPEYKQKVLEVIDVYADNLEKYGHLTWYEWCCEAWGTKWNAGDSTLYGRFITFDTAWSAPLPVFEKLIERFPDIPMDIYWYEEQGIEYVGELTTDGKGNAWLYEGGHDKFAAAVYAKCNDGEDVRFYDGSVITRDEFECDKEYFVEEMGCPDFDEMESVAEIVDVAKSFGKKIASA